MTCPPTDCTPISTTDLNFLNRYLTFGYQSVNLTAQLISKTVQLAWAPSSNAYGVEPLTPLLFYYDLTRYQLWLLVNSINDTALGNQIESGLPPVPTTLKTYKLVCPYSTSSQTYGTSFFVPSNQAGSTSLLDAWGFTKSSASGGNYYNLHPAHTCVDAKGSVFYCMNTKVSLQPDPSTHLTVIQAPVTPFIVTSYPVSPYSTNASILTASLTQNRRTYNLITMVNYILNNT